MSENRCRPQIGAERRLAGIARRLSLSRDPVAQSLGRCLLRDLEAKLHRAVPREEAPCSGG